MKFEYDEYKSASLNFPIGIVLFCIMLIISMIVLYFVIGYKKDQRSLLQLYVSFAIPILLIIPSLIYLSSGYHLLSENEQDYIIYTGEIIEINVPIKSPRYYYDGEAVSASIITVDDLELYFMTSGNLQIGDTITVKYLPKSTYVLEVEVVNRQ